jgi:hypothetical protein
MTGLTDSHRFDPIVELDLVPRAFGAKRETARPAVMFTFGEGELFPAEEAVLGNSIWNPEVFRLLHIFATFVEILLLALRQSNLA